MKMSLKGICSIAAWLAALSCAAAVEWRNIGDEDFIAGVKISSPEKLQGRVVIVDVWGVNCPPCRALLPELQKIWQNFGLPANKPLVVLGSHRQERADARVKALVKKAKVTYPIYQGAHMAEGEPSSGGAIPFLYVLNHRGQVVYKGREIRSAQEAAINALGEVGHLPSLTDGVYFTRFKEMERQLVLGKPIKPMVRRLEAAAESKDDQAADEAKRILRGIRRGLANTKAEINYQMTVDPKEALRLIKLMKITWPEEAEAAYKADVPKLIAEAKKKSK